MENLEAVIEKKDAEARSLAKETRIKLKSLKMDNARFGQSEDGSIVVKPRNFAIWFLIIVLAIFLLFFLWVILSGLLHGSLNANNIGLVLLLTALIFVLTRSLRKSTIFVNVPTRIIEIKQGVSTQQILFSAVDFIAIDKGAYYNVNRGIHILVALKNKEVIPFGKISGSDVDVHSRAELIAEALAHKIGVEINQVF